MSYLVEKQYAVRVDVDHDELSLAVQKALLETRDVFNVCSSSGTPASEPYVEFYTTSKHAALYWANVLSTNTIEPKETT